MNELWAGVLPMLVGLLLATPATGQTPARLLSCYDGDTCTFSGLRDTTVTVRLAGIDTPEMDGNCRASARRAKRALTDQLRSARTVRVRPVETGRYGRVIGRVYADTTDVSRWLVRRGLAVPYGQPTCVAPAESDAPPGLPYDPDGPDRDCGDFERQSVAQRFFIAAGGPERKTRIGWTGMTTDGPARACREDNPSRARPQLAEQATDCRDLDLRGGLHGCGLQAALDWRSDRGDGRRCPTDGHGSAPPRVGRSCHGFMVSR